MNLRGHNEPSGRDGRKTLAWADKNQQKMIQALEHEIPSRREEKPVGRSWPRGVLEERQPEQKTERCTGALLLPDLRKISKHRDQANGFKSWAKNTNKKTPKARTCTGRYTSRTKFQTATTNTHDCSDLVVHKRGPKSNIFIENYTWFLQSQRSSSYLFYLIKN
jgi:hypothetical protein